MGNNSTGMVTGKAILLTIGIMLCIGWIISLGTPKCQKSGCHNDAKEGSSYCYLIRIRGRNPHIRGVPTVHPQVRNAALTTAVERV